MPDTSSDTSVDCGTVLAPLVLLTSDGISNDGMRIALRELVLQLPDSAWSTGDGAARKKRALAQDSSSKDPEPDLYSGLKVAIIEDTCFLKESFWNSADPNYNASGGLNYAIAGARTKPSVVQPFFGKGLDGGWCSDWASALWGGIGGLGFDESAYHHINLFDQLAPSGALAGPLKLITAAARGESLPIVTVPPAVVDPNLPEVKAVLDIIDSAALVIFNGGNPDFGGYVLREFAPVVWQRIKQRLADGKALFMGRSAGAMVSSADFGLTMEGLLLQPLLSGSTRGLGVTSNCAYRPHFQDAWQLASSAYEGLTGLQVVRAKNGAGLQCLHGACKMVGVPTNPTLATPSKDGPGVLRLARAFQEHALLGANPRLQLWDRQGLEQRSAGHSLQSFSPVGLSAASCTLGAILGALVTKLLLRPSRRVSQDEAGTVSRYALAETSP